MRQSVLLHMALVVLALVLAVACTRETVREVPVIEVVTQEVVKEVPVEKIVEVEKETVRTVEVEKPVEVIKEVVRTVEVPGETVVVEKEVVRTVEVPGETVVVEKEVVRTVEVEKEVEVVREVVVEVPSAGEEKVLTISSGESIPNFNPHLGPTTTQAWVFSLVFSRLIQPNPAGSWAPDLAERWEVAPDGSSYTFFLRKNAVFHDGTPVTAKDVAFSFKSYLGPSTVSKWTGRLSLIKGADDYTNGNTNDVAGIVVVDDHTVRFDMEFPTGLFLINCCDNPGLAILPEHILGQISPENLDQSAYFTEQVTGSGPFKFVKFASDQFIELEANPDYFFGRPKIDRVVFRFIKSIDAAQIALQRGDIHMPLATGGSEPTTEMYEAAITDPRIRLVGAPSGILHSYATSEMAEDLRDPRIRQAFLHALDREKLIETFRADNGLVVNSFMVHGWYQRPEWNQLYPYDPDKARALLAEAGWDSNREVTVKVITMRSEELRSAVAAEQQMLANVGFKIKIEEMESTAWVDAFYNTRDFEMIRVRFGTFSDPDGFLSFHMKTGSRNAMDYANPELDGKIEAGKAAVNQSDRVGTYQEINDEMVTTLPLAPLFLENKWWIIDKRWIVPPLDGLEEASRLDNVPLGGAFMGSADNFTFHPERWDLKQ